MISELARDTAAMYSELRLLQIGTIPALGPGHPATASVAAELSLLATAVGTAADLPDAGARAALAAQLQPMRTLADQLRTLEGTGPAQMAAKLSGIADVVNLLAGGEVTVPA